MKKTRKTEQSHTHTQTQQNDSKPR